MTRHQLRLPDGRMLAWQEWGNGPPLVLLHGWSLSGAAFAELGAFLGAVRLLLPDLPGHGGSSPGPVTSLTSLADDIARWLAVVAQGPVMLGGWSLGGMVALQLASRRDVAIDRLVLLATTPRFTTAPDWPHGLPPGQVRALRRNLARDFEATLGDFFALTFADGEVDSERLRVIRSSAVRPGGLPDPAAAAACLELLASQDQRLLLPAVACPALVMHGTLDRVTPIGAGRALAAALPHGRLREVVGAGHAPFWSRPQAAARAIAEFCA